MSNHSFGAVIGGLLMAVVLAAPLSVWAEEAEASGSLDVDEAISAYHAGEYEKAARGIVPAAEQGEWEAMWVLAHMHLFGYAVEKSEAKYDEWMAKGVSATAAPAESGDPDAQYHLGLAYLEGMGELSEDPEQAEHWLERADANGHENAVNVLQAHFR